MYVCNGKLSKIKNRKARLDVRIATELDQTCVHASDMQVLGNIFILHFASQYNNGNTHTHTHIKVSY